MKKGKQLQLKRYRMAKSDKKDDKLYIWWIYDDFQSMAPAKSFDTTFSFFEDISPAKEMKSNTTFDWTCTIPGHKDTAWGQRTCKVDEQSTVVIIMITPDDIMMFHDSYLYTASYLQPVLMHRLPILAHILSSTDVPTGRDFQDPCHHTYTSQWWTSSVNYPSSLHTHAMYLEISLYNIQKW